MNQPLNWTETNGVLRAERDGISYIITAHPATCSPDSAPAYRLDVFIPTQSESEALEYWYDYQEGCKEMAQYHAYAITKAGEEKVEKCIRETIATMEPNRFPNDSTILTITSNRYCTILGDMHVAVYHRRLAEAKTKELRAEMSTLEAKLKVARDTLEAIDIHDPDDTWIKKRVKATLTALDQPETTKENEV